MAEISAQAVKELREKTGAGMMDCKKALTEAGGDPDKAAEVLRERGLAKAVKRGGRQTSEGAVGMALLGRVGALVEVGCETDFVAKTPEFQELAARLARAVAASRDVDSPEALLAADVEGEKGEQRIVEAVATMGENIVVKRVSRLFVPDEGLVGGYVHMGGKLGAIVGLETGATGETVEKLARDLSMHVTAADPPPIAVDRDGVPAEVVEAERSLYRRQAQQEGKPEQVIDKIAEGKVNKYYKEVVLLEQPFVKDPDRSVRQVVEDVGQQVGAAIRVAGFRRYKLGESG